MKINKIVPSLLAIGILAFALTACESESDLKAQAKISKAEATQIAMAKVPNGTIKEGELEKEKGHLIWSFDIAIPGSADIKEVNVDAITGEVVSVETENPAAQAREKAEDAKKEKDDDDKK